MPYEKAIPWTIGLNRTGHMSFLTGQDQTGPDTQICRTGPALDIHFKTFTYQITEFH